MSVYYEFGGGLGDVLNQCYRDGCYRTLERLDGPADIVILCHNPFAKELFDYHPRRHLMNVRCLPYHLPGEDGVLREAYGLPLRGAGHRAGPLAGMTYYLSDEDRKLLEGLPRPYVVIAAAAGLADRDIPPWIIAEVVPRLCGMGITPVFVGRSYRRYDRHEYWRDRHLEGTINLIDRLTVPGSCRAVQECLGLVTCHSALSLVGWHERRPQLLIYPESVRLRHFLQEDEWSFGRNYPNTFQATTTSDEGVRMAMENFLSHIHSLVAEAPVAIPERDYPAGARSVGLHWPAGRLTGPEDCRLLLWELARHPEGHILEIGCNRGITTMEMAMAFPDRLILAVDYPWAVVCAQQEGERPQPHEFCDCARSRPNVLPIFKPMEHIDPRIFAGVGAVFVDGNHTYDGVSRDTRIALQILAEKGGLIAWHDCFEGSPAWNGVTPVVRERVLANPGNVWKVRDSWFAFEEVKPASG